jgi:hypothetical protein
MTELRKQWKENKLTILVGLAIAVITGIGVPWWLSHHDPDPPRESDLEVIELDVAKPPATAHVKSLSNAPPAGATAGSEAGGDLPALDLTVRNRGTVSSIIDRVDVRIQDLEQTRDCLGAPGVVLPPSATYDVLLPGPPVEQGQVIRHDVSQQIKPGGVDRFRLGLAAGSRGMFRYKLAVSLLHDDGDRLGAGTVNVDVPGARPC